MCRTMKELQKNIIRRRELIAKQKKIEEELKGIDASIVDYTDSNGVLSDKGVLTVTGKDFIITVSVCTRRTLDSKRLEADLGSLAEYEKVSQYRRLYVK